MRIIPTGKSIGAISIMEKEDVADPNRHGFRDIELVDFEAKSGYLEFLTKERQA